jgi:hypothetical protein
MRQVSLAVFLDVFEHLLPGVVRLLEPEVHVAQVVLARLSNVGALERLEGQLVDLPADLHPDEGVDRPECAVRRIRIDDVLNCVKPLDRRKYWHGHPPP